MKTTIFYFSATGNSLHVARKLAEQLDNCTCISIPAALRQHKINDVASERIGFVFPTHYFGLPPMVSTLIGQMAFDSVGYSFAVATNGSNRYLSCALQQVEMLLAAKGLTLNGCFHVPMISSYTPLSDIPPAEKVAAKLTKADQIVAGIAQAILSRQAVQAKEPLWRLFQAFHTYWKTKQRVQAYRKFFNQSGCNACGLCKNICPVSNIEMQDRGPVWRAGCQECLACLHFCPTGSIQFGKRTAGRKQYHHPAVNAADIIASK